MKSVCIFCGSRKGSNENYISSARELGLQLAQNNISLIYGGGKVGLMGEIADSVMSNGGEAIGVIPEFLCHEEVAHKGLTRLIVVDSMHQRKMQMSLLAESFIAMPGGFGTLEELAEIITWNQLNLVNKPVGILNIEGYFDHLLNFFDHSVKENFVGRNFRDTILVESEPALLISRLKNRIAEPQSDKLSKT